MFLTYRRLYRVVAACLIIGLAAACETDDRSEFEQDPAFHAGFSDGCRTAKTIRPGIKRTVHRNEALFQENEPYRVGWRDGFSSCEGPQVRDREIFVDDFWGDNR